MQTEHLLRQVGRPVETILGLVCAIISLAFLALLVYLVYMIGWRNPHQYGSHDLLKFGTLVLFVILLSIAVMFSVFAFKLLQRKKSRKGLMSPLVLRVWGSFFVAGSAVVLLDCIAHRRWRQLPKEWEILATSISMAVAAFTLAKIRDKSDRVA